MDPSWKRPRSGGAANGAGQNGVERGRCRNRVAHCAEGIPNGIERRAQDGGVPDVRSHEGRTGIAGGHAIRELAGDGCEGTPDSLVPGCFGGGMHCERDGGSDRAGVSSAEGEAAAGGARGTVGGAEFAGHLAAASDFGRPADDLALQVVWYVIPSDTRNLSLANLGKRDSSIRRLRSE